MKKPLLIGAAIVVLAGGGWLAWNMVRLAQPAVHSRPDNGYKKETAKEPLGYVDSVLAKMTLREKVASLLIANTPGTDPRILATFVDAHELGGFILMSENIPASDPTLQAETAA